MNEKRFQFLDTPREEQGEFRVLSDLIYKQNQARENFEDEDPAQLAEFIKVESQELIDAIDQDHPAIAVASEIGDILFVTLKLCRQLGIDPRDALEMKMLRNALKYNDMSNSVGNYSEGREAGKAIYEGMGGDNAFYNAFIEIVDDPLEFVEPPVEPLIKKEEVVYVRKPGEPDFRL